MANHVVTLGNQWSRDRAKLIVQQAPVGYVMRIAEPRRTNEQNDKMWAMLTDASMSKPLGRMHTPDDWKAIFMNACGWECQFLPGLDGRPFPQGFRSSSLTKSQMSALIEYMNAFGAEHGVRWSGGENNG